MGPVSSKVTIAAMTLVEVLVVIAIVLLLLMFAIPIYDRHPTRARNIQCSNYLRQIGVCLQVFATEHGSQFPQQVSQTNGGSMEFIGKGSPAAHFLRLSNEMGEHFRMWICPTEKLKAPAKTYTEFDDRNVSYFLSMDASPGAKQAQFLILAGDRNLEAAGHPVKPGLFALTTKVPVDWTRELHSESAKDPGGVTLFVDGHVKFLTRRDIGPAVAHQGLATNLLAVP